MFPVGSALFMKLCFKAARDYPKECKETRVDIDRRLTKAILEWEKSK